MVGIITQQSNRELQRLARVLSCTAPALNLDGHRVAIRQIRVDQVQAQLSVSRHIHSFYEAILVLQHSVAYSAHMDQQVPEGGSVLFAPHAPHAWATEDEPCTRLVLWFDVSPAITFTPPARWPVERELILETELLFHDTQLGRPGWRARAVARLTVILSQMLAQINWGDQTPLEMAGAVNVARVVDQFLHDNLQQQVSLADIALQVGMSERSLTRHYRGLTGMSVMDTLHALRMGRAAALLTDTDLPVNEVGEQIGIPDASYFVMQFRKFFHQTPLHFRKSQQE